MEDQEQLALSFGGRFFNRDGPAPVPGIIVPASMDQGTRTVETHDLKEGFSVPDGPGLHVILGAAATGKTVLSTSMASQLGLHYVQIGEPLGGLVGTFPNYVRTIEEHAPSGVMIDSLRYLIYMAGGSLGKGGISMSLMADITNLDILAHQYGWRVWAVLNPLLPRDQQTDFDRLQEVLLGSVTSVLTLRRFGEGTISSRLSDDRDQKSVRFSISKEEDPAEVQSNGVDSPWTHHRGIL